METVQRLLAPRALLRILVALTAVELVVLAVRLRDVIADLYTNADTASATVIGALLGEAPADRVVHLGHYPWYSSLWFMRLTADLPGHRQIWMLAPVAATVLVYALLSATAWRTFGRTAGVLAACLLAATSPLVRTGMFTLDTHGGAAVHAIVLAAVLVALAARPTLTRPAVLVPAGLVLAAFTAGGVASDRLVVPSGLAPFVGAALVAWWISRAAEARRVAIFAVVVAGLALAGGAVLTSLMHHRDILPAAYDVAFVRADLVVRNLQLAASGLIAMASGDVFERRIDLGALPVFAAFAVALTALWLLLRAGVAAGRSARAGAVARHEAAALPPGQAMYLAFWALALLCSLAAFVLSSVPENLFSARYLIVGYVGAIALVAVLGARARHRSLVLAGAIVIVAVSLHTLASRPLSADPDLPSARQTDQIEAWLKARGVRNGYAGYWTAAPTTWQSRLRLRVAPVQTCEGRLCPFTLNTISSWYRPKPGKSFLLIAGGPSYEFVTEPDPASTPIDQGQVGPVRIYVYADDIAARFRNSDTRPLPAP